MAASDGLRTPETDQSPAVRQCEEDIVSYSEGAARARCRYVVLECAILLVGAVVTISGAVWSGNTTVPTILGAVTIALTGFRHLVGWQEAYIRFVRVVQELVEQRNLYAVESPPYSDLTSRDRELMSKINLIAAAQRTSSRRSHPNGGE